MNWFILSLISVFIVSFANILRKVLMKDDDSDPITYSIVFHFLMGLISLVIAIPFGYELPSFNQNLVFFLIAALFWGLGTILLFKALQVLESSEVTIITSSRALITIIASLLFLNETFSLAKVIGTILILSSIFLVRNVKQGFSFNKGFLYTLGVAFFYGVAVIFDVINLKSYDSLSCLATTNLLIGVILALLFWKKLPGLRKFLNVKLSRNMFLLGILSVAQAVAFYLALQLGPTSQVAPINQAQVIITVLLGVIFLKEKDNLWRKLLATLLVTIGVILLR